MLKRMKDMRDMVEAAPGMVAQAQQLSAQAQQMAAAQQAAYQARAAQAVGAQPGGFAEGASLVPGTGAVSQAAARSTELLRTGAWLVVSVAGTAFGIALSASLISMLR